MLVVIINEDASVMVSHHYKNTNIDFIGQLYFWQYNY